jgi:hypothetical protein
MSEMSAERPEDREGFLSRWSRVKTEAREAPAGQAVSAPAYAPPAKAQDDSPAPELPPIEELTPESDFRGFFHPKVDDDLRRAALKKLFSDPHFNVMDGLDVYIDDYSKTEPIPAAMLASLKQAQRIFQWAAETEEAAARAAALAQAPVREAIEPPRALENEASDASMPSPESSALHEPQKTPR